MPPLTLSDIDILISVFIFCSATSLCKLAQTCRLFRNLILERGEEIARTRLQIAYTGRDTFRALLYEFGGLYVWNSANRLIDVFHIDGERLLDWQKSKAREILKRTSLIFNQDLKKIVKCEMQFQGVKLLRYFTANGLFPIQSKIKELYYYEQTETSFFNTIVILQEILVVFLEEFTSSDLVTWLVSKASLLPLPPPMSISIASRDPYDIRVLGRISVPVL
jgi:hypothetical protein